MICPPAGEFGAAKSTSTCRLGHWDILGATCSKVPPNSVVRPGIRVLGLVFGWAWRTGGGTTGAVGFIVFLRCFKHVSTQEPLFYKDYKGLEHHQESQLSPWMWRSARSGHPLVLSILLPSEPAPRRNRRPVDSWRSVRTQTLKPSSTGPEPNPTHRVQVPPYFGWSNGGEFVLPENGLTGGSGRTSDSDGPGPLGLGIGSGPDSY